MSIKERMRPFLPKPVRYLYSKLRGLPEDLPHVCSFLFSSTKTPSSFIMRAGLVLQCYRISYSVECPHMEHEIIRVMRAIFAADPRTPGVVLEAGSFKGGSGSKLSRAARLAGRKFIIFDSFEGIPPHHEAHGKNIFGGDAYFPPGSYAGSLEEVKKAIGRYGALEVCVFVKGWFNDTMPDFKEPVIAAYVDVDLESSTRTCLTYLYPLLVPKGSIFSQDGHLPWIVKLLNDDGLWQSVKTPGDKDPMIRNVGKEKLVEITKQ